MPAENPLLPAVASWRIAALRILYLVIAVMLSSFVWQQLLFESADWPPIRGIAKAMMAAMALLCLVGVRYPLQMLPIMLFELFWKTIWLLMIALPAQLNDRWNPDFDSILYECLAALMLYAIVPWGYVWARFVRHRGEPWR
ncbi:MAG: hypothetical protein AAFO81_12365 [Pseudomonadota bacterium]